MNYFLFTEHKMETARDCQPHGFIVGSKVKRKCQSLRLRPFFAPSSFQYENRRSAGLSALATRFYNWYQDQKKWRLLKNKSSAMDVDSDANDPNDEIQQRARPQ